MMMMININNRKKNPYIIVDNIRIQKIGRFLYITQSTFQVSIILKEYDLGQDYTEEYFYIKPKTSFSYSELRDKMVVFTANKSIIQSHWLDRTIVVPRIYLPIVLEWFKETLKIC